jgi:hypothetical protein
MRTKCGQKANFYAKIKPNIEFIAFCMRGPVGQNDLPSKFGFCLGLDRFRVGFVDFGFGNLCFGL